MANKKSKEKRKVPFAVLRKGLLSAVLGVSMFAGGIGLLGGCSQGKVGPAGPQGDPGTAGQNGATWLTGTVVPDVIDGQDGDLYLDTQTNDIYLKVGGVWTKIGNIQGAKGDEGDPGEEGNPGADGATWLTGSGAPNAATGKNGDLYLDTTTFNVYLKTAGAWDDICNIKGDEGDPGQEGDPGADGATWLSGAGVPDAADGKNGDLYLDTTTFNVYLKTAGAWNEICNIKGAEGDPGQEGDPGTDGATWLSGAGVPDAADGKNGDLYLDTETCNVYVKADDAWGQLINIKGQQGVQGPQGEPGVDGATWLTGSGDPDAAEGKDGDLYLDTTTFNVYLKEAGAWNEICNIKGDEGDPGQEGDPGADGATWLSGAGVPDAADGKNGDLYLDTTTFNVYLKTAGAWNEICNIKGAEGDPGKEGDPGADGATWLSGAGVPDAADGKNGDLYLDTETCNVYVKADDAWGQLINIKGQQGVQGPQGEPGATITNISITYKYINGVEYMVFTFEFSDGREPVVEEVETPKRVDYISFAGETTFNMCEEGDEPTIQICVTYSDGSYGYVDVTPGMFVMEENGYQYDELDFQTAGEYEVCIQYAGKTTSVTINITDPNDTTLMDIYLRDSSVVMEATSSDINEIVDYTGMKLCLQLANGTTDEISLAEAIAASEATVDLSAFSAVNQPFTATVSYQEKTAEFTILPLEDMSQMSINYGYYTGTTMYAVTVNEDVVLDGYLTMNGTVNEAGYVYYIPASTDLLVETIDTTTENIYNTSFDADKIGCSLGDVITIYVYDESNIQGNSLSIYHSRLIANESEYSDIHVSKNMNVLINSQSHSITQSQTRLTEEMITSGELNLNERGVYEVEITYDGVVSEISIEVYDPEVCNIYAFNTHSMFDNIRIPTGSNIDEMIQSLYGQTMEVYYVKDVNGESYVDVAIEEGMVDYSNVDTTKAGYYTFTISYTLPGQSVGYSQEYYVEVYVDMGSATLIDTYTLPADGKMNQEDATIKVYNNGYATINDNMEQYCAYGIVNSSLMWIDMGMMGNQYYTISAEKVLSVYVPEGTIKTTYILDMEGMPLTINTYGDENYTECGTHFATVTMSMGETYHMMTLKVTISDTNPEDAITADYGVIEGYNYAYSIDAEKNLIEQDEPIE